MIEHVEEPRFPEASLAEFCIKGKKDTILSTPEEVESFRREIHNATYDQLKEYERRHAEAIPRLIVQTYKELGLLP